MLINRFDSLCEAIASFGLPADEQSWSPAQQRSHQSMKHYAYSQRTLLEFIAELICIDYNREGNTGHLLCYTVLDVLDILSGRFSAMTGDARLLTSRAVKYLSRKRVTPNGLSQRYSFYEKNAGRFCDLEYIETRLAERAKREQRTWR